MRTFNYSDTKNQKWDCEILGLIAAIYKEAGKQEWTIVNKVDRKIRQKNKYFLLDWELSRCYASEGEMNCKNR